MNKILIAGVLAASVGLAQANEPTAAPTATGTTVKTEDCAAAMKAIIPLPTKFRELMTAVTEGLNMHATWVGMSNDPAAKAEAKALKKVANDHAVVAKQMTTIITDFEALGKVGPAPHDMSKMDAKWGETMMKQIKLEREMATLMMKHAEESEKMMQSGAKPAEHAAR